MRNRSVTLACGIIFVLGIAGAAAGQDKGEQEPSARRQLQQIHSPRSMDEELAHLTKDLELSPKQQQQVRPLLQKHHDRIQALLDRNPKASRQELAPQIHTISDDTHRKIHALLTDHQRTLEKGMLLRGNHGGGNRQPAPPATVPEPSSLDS